MKKIMLICLLLTGITAAGKAQVTSVTDPAEKAKGLQKQLTLTDAQTVKIAAIYKESAAKYDKIKADAGGNTNSMLTPVTSLRKATIAKIKTVLTPSQALKYSKLVKTSKQPGSTGWSDGWSSASGN